jgi:hypothetical protein
MHPVIYDLHVHAYQVMNGTHVSVTVHDPQKRTLRSDALLHMSVDVQVSPGDLTPEQFVQEVLIATAECL